jgi:hypothetical protein
MIVKTDYDSILAIEVDPNLSTMQSRVSISTESLLTAGGLQLGLAGLGL